MASTLVNTIQVKNISRQVIPINITKRVGSPIFTKSGTIQLAPGRSVEAEDDRFDISQVRSLAKNNLLSFERFRRTVTIVEDDSSDASGATS